MTTSPICLLARYGALAAAAIAALAGCAAAPTQAPAERARETTAPAATANRNVGFAAGLRCMDSLLLDYGTRDVAVIVEDLADQTQRAKVGTKDVLVSVVSDMTQRSRAVRLVASGKDWGNTVNHMSQALKREPAAAVPQYALRGSLTQLDTTLSLDLTMLSTQDMSVVPGTATRNSVALGRRANGQGLDGRAEIRKFGVSHAFSTRPEDIVAESTRAVVELGAIELFGRLARVPYWNCLGIADTNEAVSAEIQDWYDTMAARPAEIIRYFQAQMRQRRAYDGPVDGAVNAQFRESVAAYREALGLSREAKLSLDFFRAYLGADHAQTQARLAAAPQTAAAAAPAVTSPAAAAQPAAHAASHSAAVPAPIAAPSTTAAPAAAAIAPADRNPLGLRISAANDARRFTRGEAINLTIRPSRDAHVYCFLQDENRKIIRFFPNRFHRDSLVTQTGALQLPGAGRFQILMNKNGTPETVSCFATDRDVLAQLPANINGGDFEPLGATSLDQVRTAFARVAGSGLAHEQFLLLAK